MPELSAEEIARRERIAQVFKDKYADAVMGDEAAWREILRANDSEPDEKQMAEFRASEGSPIFQAERNFQMLGLPRPQNWLDKVRKAQDAYNKGLDGDLEAWKQANALMTGRQLSGEEIEQFKVLGGPPPVQIERQHLLLGDENVRPQGHIDRLRRIDEMVNRGLAGDRAALQWLEAAFGHERGHLTPDKLRSPSGQRLEFGGLADGLVAGPSTFLEPMFGGGRSPGGGGGGSTQPDASPQDGPGGRDGGHAPDGDWAPDPFDSSAWRPGRGGSAPDGGSSSPDGGGSADSPTWQDALDALSGPSTTSDETVSGPRGSGDAGAPDSPGDVYPDSWVNEPYGSRRKRTKTNAEVDVSGDFEAVEVLPGVLGYIWGDRDGDGRNEATDPNTGEQVEKDPNAGGDQDGDTDDGGSTTDDGVTDGDGDEMPNPLDDGVAVVIDPNKPPIALVIGGGDPVGPDRDRPSINATGPILADRDQGVIDPPQEVVPSVAIDPDKPPIKIVIGGGDPVDPNVDGGTGRRRGDFRPR